MSGDLYATDILAWSRAQADRLRRLREGERPNDVDWDNLLDEVESVGRSEFHAVESNLDLALKHLMKQAAWPGADPDRHWRGEVRAFLRNARRRFGPSMAHELDLESIYGGARAEVMDSLQEGRPPGAFAPNNPYTLSDLLRDPPDIDALLAAIRAPDQAAAASGADSAAG